MVTFPAEAVTRVRRQLVHDEMSGQATLSDWVNAAEVPVVEALFSPGTTAEFPAVDLDTLSALAVLYLPYGADVKAGDRVRARGSLWAVEGRRADWPGSLASGSVVNLRWIREEG